MNTFSRIALASAMLSLAAVAQANDGRTTFTANDGSFTIIHEASGELYFLDATGADVARVAIPTNQGSSTTAGQLPNAVVAAIDAAKANGAFDASSVKELLLSMSQPDLMLLVTWATVNEGKDVVEAILSTVGESVAPQITDGAVFVANVVNPNNDAATPDSQISASTIGEANAAVSPVLSTSVEATRAQTVTVTEPVVESVLTLSTAAGSPTRNVASPF